MRKDAPWKPSDEELSPREKQSIAQDLRRKEERAKQNRQTYLSITTTRINKYLAILDPNYEGETK